MIAAVATVRQEADIIGHSLAHLRANGISDIRVAVGPSTDATEDICRDAGARVVLDHDVIHRQPYWINRLAYEATSDGADWILPFDADEFPYTTHGGTIREALEGELHAGVLFLRHHQHRDWRWRKPEPQYWPKVAFRYAPGRRVENGNHGVGSLSGTYDVLNVREVPFRSLEHFKRKVAERNASLDPGVIGEGGGWHMRVLADADDEKLAVEYGSFCGSCIVNDPIPCSPF